MMGVAASVAGLAACLLLTFVAAFVGSRFPADAWYQALAKPSWTPPGWIFGPVWTLLYALMAVAAWLVWRRSGIAGAWLPLLLFAAQLVLNAAWSWLFFGLRRPDLALADIVALLAVIVLLSMMFHRISSPAGWIMLPYVLWVSFATALNASIVLLNRG